MGFLICCIDLIRGINKAKKTVMEGRVKKEIYKKLFMKFAAKYAGIALVVLLFFGTLLYGITSGIQDSWEYLCKLTNSTDIDVIYDRLANLTEEERLEFEKNVAFLVPEKIMQYIDKQRQSVPPEVMQTKTINDDGNISTESIPVDVNKLTAKYILPWQLIGAMDIITFNGMDIENQEVLNASNLALSQFNWTYDATRDEAKYWKTWEVKEKHDSKLGTKVTYDGEDSAEEHIYEVKTPLGLLDSVDTAFGLYKYNINRDVVLVDEPYSARQLVSKVCTGTERVVDYVSTHTNEDGSKSTTTHYKTISYYTYTYTKTRNTLIEDQMSGPDFTFNPTKFIQFLNGSGYKIEDLDLLQLALEAMPNTSNTLDMITRIIDGDYGDLNMGMGGVGGTGGMGGIGGADRIPLFHQWDEAWGNIVYGSGGTIGTSGCGPTSMAMILTGLRANLTGLDTNNDGICDPAEAAAYSVSHGYRVPGVGTSWGYFPDIASKAGLNCRTYSTSQYQQVYEELKKGNPVIASMGPGHFTSQGHFIVLAYVLEDGKVKVNDPNKQICSDTPWDMSLITSEARQFWAFDNPNFKGDNFTATAYSATAEECGNGLGITANGTPVLDKNLSHKLIAVDPTVIPMNSLVYIEVPADKRYQTLPNGEAVDMNGYYKAVDTGSAIKGNIVDIYFGTGKGYVALCDNFGRQPIILYR